MESPSPHLQRGSHVTDAANRVPETPAHGLPTGKVKQLLLLREPIPRGAKSVD